MCFNGNMMKHTLIIATILLAACASGANVTQLPPVQPDQARIIITRPASLSGIMETVHVSLDGKELLTLSNGETEYADIQPGAHELHSEHFIGSGATQPFEIKPQETLTFQTGWHVNGFNQVGAYAVPQGQFGLAQIN